MILRIMRVKDGRRQEVALYAKVASEQNIDSGDELAQLLFDFERATNHTGEIRLHVEAADEEVQTWRDH